MPRKNKKYSQKLINSVHTDKLAGDTLRELQRNHNLTMNQLTYVLYTRSPAEKKVKEIIPDVTQRIGSAPPSKIGLWDKVKLMLGF
tara:strand:- start:457 stop:714 length:258 start_codon:yes stop_codon:yes gene_type:complete